MTKILFINSIQKQCGVHSYGLRSFNILKKSEKYEFIYVQPESDADYQALVFQHQPEGIIYNFHPSTMTWFQGCRMGHIKHYVLWHEGVEYTNLTPDYWLYVDSTRQETKDSFAIPRPLIEVNTDKFDRSNHLVISTFGMAFGNKGFGRVVKMVNDQFDLATVRIHIPRAYYGDRYGEATAGVMPGCMSEVTKPGIKLEFSHDFKTDQELISFLHYGSLNLFLYDEMKGRGLSSVIDYALSAGAPFGINSSDMFRHIQVPEINVENNSLKDLILSGQQRLQQFRDLWSNKNFLEKYESILRQTL